MYRLPKVICLFATVCFASGTKILMVPPQIGSHILEQIIIGEALAQRGHQVFMTLGTPFIGKEGVEKRGMSVLQFKIPKSDLYGFSPDMDKLAMEWIFGEETDKMASAYGVVSKICYRDCSYMINDREFMETVRKVSPDLAIVEAFLPASCNYILPKVLGIPYISTSLLNMPWEHRFPALPSFSPLLLPWTSSSDVTLMSRLQNLLNYLRMESNLDKMAPRNYSLLEKYAPEVKTWNELVHRSELFLVSTDHYFDNTVPQMPNYISMAGISANQPKKLPKDLEEIVENAKNGVVILSFGSIIQFFPANVIATFLGAFGKLNQTVLVKFHIPEGLTVPENVKPFSWLPQNDLLGHPNTKLFVTHCGNGGLHEALYHGVPIVGFPLFAEQHINCQRSYKKGFGLCMNVHDFTSGQLFDNLQEVLNNPKYRSTIQTASAIFRNQPMHPLNRTVFWIEHVIKYGGKHLRSLAMDMPLYEFLMLDVLGLLVITCCAGVFALIILMRYIRDKYFSPNKVKEAKLKSS